MTRHASVAVLGIVTAAGSGFIVYFSQGKMALDAFDFWGGTILLMILATVQAMLYGWVLGIHRAEQAAHEGAHLRIPRFVQYIIKYVSPLFLLTILFGSVITDGREYWQKLQ